MNPLQRAQEFFASHNVRWVRVIYSDIHGIARGKVFSTESFADVVASGMKNCCGVFSKDLTGTPVDKTNILWEKGADDNIVVPDLETLCLVPWESGLAQVIGDVYDDDGTPLLLSPREILKRMLTRIEGLGYGVLVGPEIEFYVFDGEGRPINTGTHAYSMHQIALAQPIIGPVVEHLRVMGVAVESFAQENASGQLEVTLRHGGALRIADWMLLTRNAIKEIGLRLGFKATFMPVPYSRATPSGCHINLSLWDFDKGQSAFRIDSDGRMSAPMREFLAGLLKYMNETLPLFLPTINSYRAAAAGSFFPVHSSWGLNNRSAAVRIPESEPHLCRLENRVPTSDCNPYLAIAGMLALGYLGLIEKPPLPPPVEGNGFELDLPRLDLDFATALHRFSKNYVARELLDPQFFDTFLLIKQSEFEKFSLCVTEWERDTYQTLL